MSASLSAVPKARRRQLAAAFGLFAGLFAAVGAVAVAGRGGAAVAVLAALAFLVALVLAIAALGVVHSLRAEAAGEAAAQLDASLDAAITEALSRQGYGSLCNCGHEHDPTELHVTDAEPCPHDGTGAACAHDCETCVLAAMRPSGRESSATPRQ